MMSSAPTTAPWSWRLKEFNGTYMPLRWRTQMTLWGTQMTLWGTRMTLWGTRITLWGTRMTQI